MKKLLKRLRSIVIPYAIIGIVVCYRCKACKRHCTLNRSNGKAAGKNRSGYSLVEFHNYPLLNIFSQFPICNASCGIVIMISIAQFQAFGKR